MIDLIVEGNLPPSTDQLAERAGVSVASVFRYFDGLEDLQQAATAVYFERFDHLFDVPEIGDGPLADRVQRLVDARLRLYSTAEPMGRLVRMRAPEHAAAADNLARLRATHADQIRHQFDAELRALTSDERGQAAAMIATLTSFESWDQCRQVHGFDESDIRAAWRASLTTLLAGRS